MDSCRWDSRAHAMNNHLRNARLSVNLKEAGMLERCMRAWEVAFAMSGKTSLNSTSVFQPEIIVIVTADRI